MDDDKRLFNNLLILLELIFNWNTKWIKKLNFQYLRSRFWIGQQYGNSKINLKV